MDFSLTPEQARLRDDILKFARAELGEGVIERDAKRVFPRELWLKCGQHRLQGLVVPSALGGRGLDPLSAVIALEALGEGCPDGGLTFSICAQLLACVVPVWKHGSRDQHEQWLPRLCNGTAIAANAMSEPDSGSDAFAMTTRAVPSNGGFILDGSKTFASNAPHADVLVTYAATDASKGYHGGITTFLVPTNTPGVRLGTPIQKLGLRTSGMCQIAFDGAWVPDTAVLGKVGGGSHIFAQSMDWERVCLGAIHVGTMQRILAKVIAYARSHKVDNEAIGKSQGVSYPIVDMKIRLDASRLLLYRAAARLESARDVAMDASIAKLFVSEALVKSAIDASRVFGLAGIVEGHEMERTLRDSLSATIYSGTSEIQRNIIGRWLGL